jgi:hypothetical protein
MKILTSEELNKLYVQIRENLKDWSKEYKIKNKDIHRYFNSNPKNIESFFSKGGIEQTKFSERVLKDILEDLIVNENYQSIVTSMSEYENKLADIFDVGLSHIELIDDTINLFKVKDFESVKKIIIINKTDKDILKSRIVQRIKSDIQKQKIIISPNPEGSYVVSTKPNNQKNNPETLELFNIQNLDKKILGSIQDKDIIDWIIKIPYNDYPYEVLDFKLGDQIDYWIIK